MPVIQLLDQSTINQIAAGEVIERPASVVKELFENALDAKATAVTVEIREGGISLIRVTDNGCGIEKEQVALAFQRHATSKIRDIMDLVTVSSLGFRGEALSSIAAVAQVEMITKPAETMLGVSYRIEDGEEKQLQDIGAPDGTTILVRNLFGHVPARRKFLKSAMTEGSHIAQMMENLALSRPDISVRFINNGQNKLYTSGNGKMKDLIYTVYGREIASNLLELNAETDCFKITGYLGKPIISRGNRGFENYYINGRFVKSALISRAIEAGYKSFMMQHRYPFTVLHLTINPEMIDVNVHPSKMELRFRQEEELYNQLVQVIENCLRGKPLIPDVRLTEETQKKEQISKGPEPFERMRLQAQQQILPGKAQQQILPGKAQQQTPPERERTMVREPEGYKTGAFSGIHRRIGQDHPQPSARNDSISAPNDSMQETPPVREAEARPAANRQEGIQPVQESGTQTGTSETQTGTAEAQAGMAEAQTVTAEHAENTKAVFEQQVLDLEQENGTGQSSAPPLLSKEAQTHHKLIGQLFDTYWLIQYEDNLYIMDQHAAHEKVLYERLMAGYRTKERLSQTLSPAMMVSLSPLEENMLKQYLPVLEEMGYQIESYGGKEYAVCAVPANLYGIDEKELFIDLLGSLQDCGSGRASELIAHKLATMSCKAAIKGGQSITFREADALISQLLTLENPYACPHGRPTIISMSRYELEKKFKRIV